MTPWLSDPDVTLYHGDVLSTLREMPDESVDCVVTSPPYWGLRDYGTGEWEGGDAGCDHKQTVARHDGGRVNVDGFHGSAAADSDKGAMNFRNICGKCGATRIDQQLGLEPTPEQYVERMVEVFREVRRVLAAHGTVWLNLGDSYAGAGYSNHENTGGAQREDGGKPRHLTGSGFKPKDLVGIPWRVAFALQADGWYLRSDIIWAKPNPMPESVTDRPTKAHEYVFLLSKQPRYFFDAEAVREKAEWARWGDQTVPKYEGTETATGWMGNGKKEDLQARAGTGRNIRSVWEIATQPYPEAHFATFPEELARRCIAAGTSEKGKCPECRAPWVRETDVSYDAQGRTTNGPRSTERRHESPGRDVRMVKNVETTGWRPSCKCGGEPDPPMVSTPLPAVVLDPFMGSGTVAYVARKLGRHAVGIDLNAEYLALAARRLQQQSLFAEVV